MRHKVLLGFPGGSMSFGAARGFYCSTNGRHDVATTHSAGSWDNFNILWASALNAYEEGEITHFAMLHADTVPDDFWLDTMIEEMDWLKADLVSVPIAIKDGRGLTSCGIGDPTNPWEPLRRFTIKETLALPETFDARTAGYPGGILLHNNGCWVADLRRPFWHETLPDGTARIFFDFPRRLSRGLDGRWGVNCESEDWYFSRCLHAVGARTFITRKVKIVHEGAMGYPNFLPWGQEHDEQSRHKWDPQQEMSPLATN